MTCIGIAIAYPDPDIPAQPAVGVAIAVLNKMVDDTDNQKMWKMPRMKVVCIACYKDFSIFFMTDGRTDKTDCLTPLAHTRAG